MRIPVARFKCRHPQCSGKKADYSMSTIYEHVAQHLTLDTRSNAHLNLFCTCSEEYSFMAAPYAMDHLNNCRQNIHEHMIRCRAIDLRSLASSADVLCYIKRFVAFSGYANEEDTSHLNVYPVIEREHIPHLNMGGANYLNQAPGRIMEQQGRQQNEFAPVIDSQREIAGPHFYGNGTSSHFGINASNHSSNGFALNGQLELPQMMYPPGRNGYVPSQNPGQRIPQEPYPRNEMATFASRTSLNATNITFSNNPNYTDFASEMIPVTSSGNRTPVRMSSPQARTPAYGRSPSPSSSMSNSGLNRDRNVAHNIVSSHQARTPQRGNYARGRGAHRGVRHGVEARDLDANVSSSDFLPRSSRAGETDLKRQIKDSPSSRNTDDEERPRKQGFMNPSFNNGTDNVGFQTGSRNRMAHQPTYPRDDVLRGESRPLRARRGAQQTGSGAPMGNISNRSSD